jgi:hypothetical protein
MSSSIRASPPSSTRRSSKIDIPSWCFSLPDDEYQGLFTRSFRGGFGLVIGVVRKGNAEELKANGAHIVVNDLADLLAWNPAQLSPAA